MAKKTKNYRDSSRMPLLQVRFGADFYTLSPSHGELDRREQHARRILISSPLLRLARPQASWFSGIVSSVILVVSVFFERT